MTDRAQPGAIDSLIRNDELRQIFSRFSEGFIVPGTDPTIASRRRGDIDATALDAFSLTTSVNSFDVTVAPGEAFVGGWFCRDQATTLSLPSSETVDVVIGYDDRAIFDPDIDDDRDAADEAIIDLKQNVSDDAPTTTAHRITTDGSGVASSERVAEVGAHLEADDATIGGVDVPSGINDSRQAINQLFINNAEQGFELGLSILEMDDGQFEVYANNNRIADQADVDLNLGSPLNGNGTVTLSDGETDGFTQHTKEDYNFLPNSLWLTDDVETNPSNGTIQYEIEDENGNVVTVNRSELDSNVDVSGTIETYAVTTRAVLKRDSTNDTKPVLDAYSAYISGTKPDDYLEANVTSVSEA